MNHNHVTEVSDAYKAIKALCFNYYVGHSGLIRKLRSILRSNPGVLAEKDHCNRTLLWWAAGRKSVEFIQVLMERNESLIVEYSKTCDTYGQLPIHYACCHLNSEAVRYLHIIYPEGLNVASHPRGHCPLHIIIENYYGVYDDILRYLTLHDRGALSKPTRDGSLGLHLACKYWLPLEDIKPMYNKYPQALLETNDDRDTPIELCVDEDTLSFFFDQIQWLEYADEGQYEDSDDSLPIFRYLRKSEVHVGTVELMIDAHPQSLISRDVLDGDYLIHHACRNGHVQVINYLLEKSYHGVATRSQEGKLPIELLFCASVDRHSSDYMEALYRLLRANPVNVQV